MVMEGVGFMDELAPLQCPSVRLEFCRILQQLHKPDYTTKNNRKKGGYGYASYYTVS